MAPSAEFESYVTSFICLFSLLSMKIIGHMALSTPIKKDYKFIAANFPYYVECDYVTQKFKIARKLLPNGMISFLNKILSHS